MKSFRQLVLVLAAATLAVGLAVAADPASEVVAKVGDKTITRAQLTQEAASALAKVRQQEYDILSQYLDQMVDDLLLEDLAKKEGKTVEQVIDERVEKKVTMPTDEQVQKFYNENPRLVQGQPLDQVKPRIIQQLQQQEKQKLYMDLVDSLTKQTSVVTMLDPPRAVVPMDDDPMRGPKDAPVQIVMFSDYECPFCSRVEETMAQVRTKYGEQVVIVFRDFPLSFHKNAQKAAEAAGCAGEQGKFWEYHDKLFANQRALAPANLDQYATELGLDMTKFKACLDSGQRAPEVAADMKAGQALGVTGTPAAFVNGRFVNGAQPLDAFAKIIDDELARAKNKPAAAATKK
jgi:protein-disulfide isomerase